MLRDIKKILNRIKRETPESSITKKEGLFLKSLAEMIEAKTIVETGTKCGYSSIWLGLTGAKVYTIDIIHEGKLHQDGIRAKENIGESGLDISIQTDGSIEFLHNFKGKIDLLFLDSHHTVEHILAELKESKGKMSENGITIIHDAPKVNGLIEAIKDQKVITLKTNGAGIAIL